MLCATAVWLCCHCCAWRLCGCVVTAVHGDCVAVLLTRRPTQQIATQLHQIGKHKCTIDALEAQKELEVNVTVTETTGKVTLQNGKRMTSSRINVGEML